MKTTESESNPNPLTTKYDYSSNPKKTDFVLREYESTRIQCEGSLSQLLDAIRGACLASRQAYEVAKRRGSRQTSTWEFTCIVKKMEEFLEMSAEQMFNSIPWDVTDFSDAERMQIFLEWDRVRDTDVPLWKAANVMALQHPRPVGSSIFQDKEFQHFLNIAFYSQRIAGEGKILLPTHELAPLLRVSARTVSLYCRVAAKLGFIRLIKPAVPHRRLAAEYRVNLQKFLSLEANA